jgi:hypothetical protein
MLLAQAVVEHGLLSSMATGIATLFDRANYYLSTGHTRWMIAAFVLVLAWVFLKPKR